MLLSYLTISLCTCILLQLQRIKKQKRTSEEQRIQIATLENRIRELISSTAS